jgi:hypothetical protein
MWERRFSLQDDEKYCLPECPHHTSALQFVPVFTNTCHWTYPVPSQPVLYLPVCLRFIIHCPSFCMFIFCSSIDFSSEKLYGISCFPMHAALAVIREEAQWQSRCHWPVARVIMFQLYSLGMKRSSSHNTVLPFPEYFILQVSIVMINEPIPRVRQVGQPPRSCMSVLQNTCMRYLLATLLALGVAKLYILWIQIVSQFMPDCNLLC